MRSRFSRRSLEPAVHLSPEEPPEDRGRVHVWLLDLDTRYPGPSGRWLLSSTELARVDRLKDPLDRRRSTSRFVLARRLLGKVMGEAPGDLSFVSGIRGKPRVVSAGGRNGRALDLNFNLSRSENVLALAVAYGRDVGVDVEVLDKRVASASFYRDWTLKEALAKLSGVGIVATQTKPHERPVSARSLELVFAGKVLALSVAWAGGSDVRDDDQGRLVGF